MGSDKSLLGQIAYETVCIKYDLYVACLTYPVVESTIPTTCVTLMAFDLSKTYVNVHVYD